MKKYICLFLLFWTHVETVFTQPTKPPLLVDSLKTELVKAKDDTTKVLIYAKLAFIGVQTPRSEKIEFAQKGYDLAKKIRFYKGIVLCGHHIGFLMVEKDYFKALPVLFDVKQLCERNKDTANLAKSYGYIGFAHMKFDNQKSIYYFRICLKLMQTAKLSENSYPINTSLGYVFKEKGDLDSALIYFEKGYQFSLRGDSPISVTSFDLQFGEIYYKKRNIPLASQYFKKSILHITDGTVGEAFYHLAKIYREQTKLDSAKYFAKQSLMYEQKYGRNTHIIKSSQLLYELYKNSNPIAALKYLEISSTTKDTLFSQEKARQVEKLAFEDKEREQNIQRRIEAHNRDFANKIEIYALLAILVGLGILAFVLYRNNKQKHKDNQVLEKTLAELKTTQAQLIQSEKLASLGELTAGIAHEIQNPLNFVNNFSELSVELIEELKAERQKAEGKRDFELEDELLSDLSQNQEKIHHHGKRASSIVSGMLEHSKASTGERVLTDINKLADEYLRLSYHGLRAKDKNFNSDFKLIADENLPKINVIPQDIGRVLLNLVNNAFYAVGRASSPSVKVETKYADNQIIIKVHDNGTGMSEATKAKIFQPFFTTKPTGQGTGLGLSLAYDIVTKGHGGTIECESVEGHGTTFMVKLPINRDINDIT
jgi:two-component system, NtrC family, sensor kinase